MFNANHSIILITLVVITNASFLKADANNTASNTNLVNDTKNLINDTNLINQECFEPKTNKSYKVGEIWNATEICEIFRCEIMEITPPGRKLRLAVGVRKMCANTTEMPNCYLVPRQHGIFPFCCPILVCVREYDVQIHYSYGEMYDNKTNVAEKIDPNEHKETINNGPPTPTSNETKVNKLPTQNSEMATNETLNKMLDKENETILNNATLNQENRKEAESINLETLPSYRIDINDTSVAESETVVTKKEQHSRKGTGKNKTLSTVEDKQAWMASKNIQSKLSGINSTQLKNKNDSIFLATKNYTLATLATNDSFLDNITRPHNNGKVLERIIDYRFINDIIAMNPLINHSLAKNNNVLLSPTIFVVPNGTLATLRSNKVAEKHQLGKDGNIRNHSGAKLNTSKAILTIGVILATLSIDPIFVTIWKREPSKQRKGVNNGVILETSDISTSNNTLSVLTSEPIENLTTPQENNSLEKSKENKGTTLKTLPASIILLKDILATNSTNLTKNLRNIVPVYNNEILQDALAILVSNSINFTKTIASNTLASDPITLPKLLSSKKLKRKNKLEKIDKKRNYLLLKIPNSKTSILKDTLADSANNTIMLTKLDRKNAWGKVKETSSGFSRHTTIPSFIVTRPLALGPVVPAKFRRNNTWNKSEEINDDITGNVSSNLIMNDYLATLTSHPTYSTNLSSNNWNKNGVGTADLSQKIPASIITIMNDTVANLANDPIMLTKLDIKIHSNNIGMPSDSSATLARHPINSTNLKQKNSMDKNDERNNDLPQKIPNSTVNILKYNLANHPLEATKFKKIFKDKSRIQPTIKCDNFEQILKASTVNPPIGINLHINEEINPNSLKKVKNNTSPVSRLSKFIQPFYSFLWKAGNPEFVTSFDI